jgi:galactokinase
MTQSHDVQEQVARASRRFESLYGRAPTIAAAAPGRVNLIGEHTDYNDGFVLPMALEMCSVVLLATRSDKTARLASTAFDDVVEFPVDIDGQTITHAPIPLDSPTHWSRYLCGVVAFSYTPHGFDLLLDSTVPVGGGLSSSASIEVATATALEAMGGVRFEPTTKALLCQMAEHRYGGAPCGIMDQFASTMGRADHALLIDCRSYEARAVPLRDPGVCVLIVNTNVKHELSGGEYAERRAACEAAARTLGVKALRDATLEQLDGARDRLDATAYRRARHVIAENARTLDAEQAMTRGDWPAVGELMYASHASLRDDFEVSTPELDLLVELASQVGEAGGVYGARMTGGGFGGCIVSLVKTAAVDQVRDSLTSGYRKKIGVDPTPFVSRPGPGARLIELQTRSGRDAR